ncbi:SDR family oxidoreductase [Candidatus Laterigemmans baculatus]|uniref:SDR family oxidoreductase n=1 Tax=Candidatus Laterigemmans baculatus TaxID=2770505 RepID=UPI001F20D873|nr:SDR family oxidoreductase [Candidatus Laterigemmans baculatus]
MPTPQDPRTLYPQPPFKDQQPFEMPGSSQEMRPKPDHGEASYQGTGKLSGMTALITGADSGIGRAVALAYAREGAQVAFNYLCEHEDAKETERLIRDAGGEPLVVPGDLREEAFCQELVDKVFDRFGRLDILVNNAAYQETRESIDEWSTEVLDRIIRTNIYGPFWLCREALPKMKPGGSIINTVSIQSYEPSPNLLPYSLTKSALAGFTKGVAKLAMEQGVRVNAVAPGPVWTPLIPGSMPLEKIQNFGSNTLFKRPAQPAELAPLYVWLASPEASYVTAEVFGATGGRTPV